MPLNSRLVLHKSRVCCKGRRLIINQWRDIAVGLALPPHDRRARPLEERQPCEHPVEIIAWKWTTIPAQTWADLGCDDAQRHRPRGPHWMHSARSRSRPRLRASMQLARVSSSRRTLGAVLIGNIFHNHALKDGSKFHHLNLFRCERK